jgi:hypothetical protein
VVWVVVVVVKTFLHLLRWRGQNEQNSANQTALRLWAGRCCGHSWEFKNNE